MKPLVCAQGFRLHLDYTTDLVFYHKWPIFELGLNTVKTNILTNFCEHSWKNEAPIVYTGFFQLFDLIT